LIEPKIELAPAKCKLKIAKSTALPGCPRVLERGGYTVQLVPAPLSVIALLIIKRIEEGKSQKLKLLRRG